MAYMVTMLNEGGALDRIVVQTGKDAATVAIQMINDAGELFPGDRIVISAIDDGQEAILRARST